MISIYHSLYPRGTKKNLDGISAYSHETAMIGGFLSASFSFTIPIYEAEDWFVTGVGRHIEVYSDSGNQVWEGIVNELAFNVGPRSIKVGPFLAISNKIKVGWQHPNYGILGDPLAGVYEETDWGSNVNSQTRYGIMEELVSGGTGEEPEMLTLQSSLLASRNEPGISEDFASGSGAPPVSVSVACVGYSKVLEKQIYNLPWQSGWTTVDLADKANAILDNNLFFVNDRVIVRDIQVTGIDVPPEEDKNRTAWGILSDHVSKSAEADGVLCGMGPRMSFRLESVAPEVVYRRRSGTSIVLDRRGNEISNSEIAVGGHMAITDFSIPVSYRITSVKYDVSGDAVSINYRDGSLRSVLNKLMLGGYY